MAWPIVGLVSFLGGIVGKLLTVETGKFLLYRGLILSLVTFVLPTVLYNLFTRIISEMMEYTMNHISSSGLSGTMVQLTGIGAWIADNIYLPSAMSIFISALGLRFTLSLFKR